MIRKIWNSLRLYFGIVGRINQADYRTGPLLALEIVRIVHWNYRPFKRL